MPRVQVANKLHEGRARARRGELPHLHASLQTVDRPRHHCNKQGVGYSHSPHIALHSPSLFLVHYSIPINHACTLILLVWIID